MSIMQFLHLKQGGEVESRWAHNSKVGGSKPLSAIFFMKILAISFLTFFAWALEIDVNTLSNYHEVQSHKLHIEWLLDLDDKYINGTAQHEFRFLQDNVAQISLDIYQLDILIVYVPQTGLVLKHEVENQGAQSLIQGDKLVIYLDRAYQKGEQAKINIKYNLDQRARALGFLTKEQTYSKKLPYLFSQCEDNNCRSIIPLQDTPSVKSYFSATVLTKDDRINVFMTGNKLPRATLPIIGHYDQVFGLHQFQLDIKIPAYLIGIIAGEVVEKSTGNRTYVISEPNYIEEYAKELEQLPDFMNALQEYIGPYIWGDYKIVILPASFPFGGMEHPLLTFASPTIIVGDKSGIGTAIHEIAHSWVGNTVTCNNWSNMWINEGFCVFLERKMQEKYKGKEAVKVDSIVGNSSMYTSMLQFGLEDSFSSLHPNTANRNPDESTSRVPYEKGFQLLKYLESLIGELEFQQMLRDYIETYKFQSIDEDVFYQFLLAWVSKHADKTKAPDIIAEIKRVYKNWVYKPGLPEITLDFSTTLYTDAIDLAKAWVEAKGAVPKDSAKYLQFQPNQKQVFLQYFIDNNSDVTELILDQLDSEYKLTNYPDKKISYRWYRGTVMAGYAKNLEGVHEFVSTVGVSSYIKALYGELKVTFPREAHEWFEENRAFYHPTLVQAIERILGEHYSFKTH